MPADAARALYERTAVLVLPDGAPHLFTPWPDGAPAELAAEQQQGADAVRAHLVLQLRATRIAHAREVGCVRDQLALRATGSTCLPA